MALAIAVVGVAGVLTFSVSARTREFGIRLALGSKPHDVLRGVIAEGALMAGAGVVAGALFGLSLTHFVRAYFFDMKMPGALPVSVSALVLMAVAIVASVVPAARAAGVNIMQALRSESAVKGGKSEAAGAWKVPRLSWAIRPQRALVARFGTSLLKNPDSTH